MAVALDPPGLAVPADDPVFHVHIAGYVPVCSGREPGAGNDPFPILRVDHAPEGDAGQLSELLLAAAAEDGTDGFVDIQQLLAPVGPADEEAAG